ncbi:MAG: response regulator [Lachnospiraceae bacterium]|uniref:Stage 0 sporulation protein A homolog n=1 Tax=Candidatus Weimeria bifida TaxID=2599074 RepID=A0A6N7IZA9_9FIRM|nr:response regulator [Candidatus Weimeria bifida]RRF97163.1 MAG: response regulator [Lachnospiraceae bacterium]
MKEKAKILIGDDSILARQQLKDTISRYVTDPIFIEAANGKEAVTKYEEEKPDLTFLDIVMPVRDGIIATLEITKKDKDAKIIIVSSIGTQKQLTAAVQAGAIDFVQKPVKDEIIQQILSKYLGGE